MYEKYASIVRFIKTIFSKSRSERFSRNGKKKTGQILTYSPTICCSLISVQITVRFSYDLTYKNDKRPFSITFTTFRDHEIFFFYKFMTSNRNPLIRGQILHKSNIWTRHVWSNFNNFVCFSNVSRHT